MKKENKNPNVVSEENNDKGRTLYIIIGSVVILVIILIAVLTNKEEVIDGPVLNEKETYIFDSDVKLLNSRLINFDSVKNDPILITSYKDYLEYYNDNKNLVLESMFDSVNFVLIPVQYVGCSEEELVITNHKIEGNNINLTIYYTDLCGICAPEYEYFLLEVPKSFTNPVVNTESHPRNKIYCDPNIAYKPIIYLYPTEKTNVNVKLLNSNLISVSYPKYNNGWNVTVDESGNIYDSKTNRNYYGLYWEGSKYYSEVTNEGFVVEGKESYKFLEEKLEILGLNEREINEFIIYWLPKLESSKYNYIRFETNESIDKYMPLEVTPTPNTVIRVYMVFKPLEEKIDVKPQVLEQKSREGFSVIEWGGSLIN